MLMLRWILTWAWPMTSYCLLETVLPNPSRALLFEVKAAWCFHKKYFYFRRSRFIQPWPAIVTLQKWLLLCPTVKSPLTLMKKGFQAEPWSFHLPHQVVSILKSKKKLNLTLPHQKVYVQISNAIRCGSGGPIMYYYFIRFQYEDCSIDSPPLARNRRTEYVTCEANVFAPSTGSK